MINSTTEIPFKSSFLGDWRKSLYLFLVIAIVAFVQLCRSSVESYLSAHSLRQASSSTSLKTWFGYYS